MQDLQWFRLYSRTIDNEKLSILAPSDRWYYVALLCCKAQGIFDAGDSDNILKRKLCAKLHPAQKELDDLAARLQEVTLVTETLLPVGWNEKQFVTDNPTYNAEKQRRYRERYKALRNGDVTVTTPETETETETEKKNIRDSSSQKSPADKIKYPYQKIIDLYHEVLPELPRVEKLTPTRKSYIRNLWNDDLNDLEYWKNFFTHIRKSDFLMGKTEPVNGRRPFRANFEWMIKPANYVKIYEDNYHV